MDVYPNDAVASRRPLFLPFDWAKSRSLLKFAKPSLLSESYAASAI
jgi:hypothetical protein